MRKALMLDKHEYRLGIRAVGLLKKILPNTKLNQLRIRKLRALLFEAYIDKNLARPMETK